LVEGFRASGKKPTSPPPPEIYQKWQSLDPKQVSVLPDSTGLVIRAFSPQDPKQAELILQVAQTLIIELPSSPYFHEECLQTIAIVNVAMRL
jgi:hypothetical protein